MDLVSASQISKFNGPRNDGDEACQRKWGWAYIAGIKEPTGPAAALGTECDDTQLQPYLRDGRAIDFTRQSSSGYIVAPGLSYLPKPKAPGIMVQRHFVIPSPTWVDGKHAGFGYQGYLDLWDLSGRHMPDLAFDPKQFGSGTRALVNGSFPPVVADFKTTGNWKYAKDQDALSRDVQAMLYATWAMYFTGARTVDLVWIYFATKGKRQSKRTHLRVHADHVAEQFSRINDTAVQMHGIRKSGIHPLDLPFNSDMCERMGGCPYRHKCNLSPGDIVDAKAARERARKGISDMSNAPTATSLLSRLRAQKAGGTTPPPAPAPTSAPAAAAPLGINPPEKDLPPAPAVGSVAAPSEVTPEAAPTPAPETIPATPTARRGPGRPPKVKPATVEVKVDVDASSVEAATVAVEKLTEKLAEIPSASSSQSKPIGTLYLDSYPVGDLVEQADTLYRKVQERIQKEHGVPDFRFIDFKGSGIFAATLAEIVDAEKIRGLVVDTSTPEGKLAKSVFIFRSGRVVQGTR